MTTDKTVSADQSGNSSASPEDEIARQVGSAAKGEQKETEVQANGSRAITLEDLERATKNIEDSVQGRMANWNSHTFGKEFESFKDSLRRDFRSEINNAVTAQANAQAEMARIDSLDSEEQVEYWRNKAMNPEPVPEPVEQQQQQQGGGLTEEERRSLASYAIGVLKTAGVDTTRYQDPQLWSGTTASMSVDQMAEVFHLNVSKQTNTSSNSSKQETPPPPPPPSTQDAPQTPAPSFESKTEIAGAFGRGEINIDQYKAELGNLRQRR